jgi:5-methylcytosine-specific restriction endonuclease McrA
MSGKPTPIEHGTLSGYKKHKKRKHDKCQPCWDARAAYMRELRKTPEQKIKSRAYAKAWKSRNKDKVLEQSRKYYRENSEKLTEQQRINRAKNPNFRDVQASASRRRRAKIKNQGFEFYREKDVIERYGKICHICNKDIDINAPRSGKTAGKLKLNWENGLHIDHVIPISKGGTDTLDNVRPSHAKCNLSKGNKIEN